DLGGSGRVLDNRFEFDSLACEAARADSWPELKDRARDPPRTGEQPSETRGKSAARAVVDGDQQPLDIGQETARFEFFPFKFAPLPRAGAATGREPSAASGASPSS